MRIKLIEDLPMATSDELNQLTWVIEQLLADARRIVQARAQLHTGQQVQYLNWVDGALVDQANRSRWPACSSSGGVESCCA